MAGHGLMQRFSARRRRVAPLGIRLCGLDCTSLLPAVCSGNGIEERPVNTLNLVSPWTGIVSITYVVARRTYDITVFQETIDDSRVLVGGANGSAGGWIDL